MIENMNPRITVLICMVLVAALARLIPHPPNFTPIAAMALFGTAHFKSRWAAFLVPLLAMLVSDVALACTRDGWRTAEDSTRACGWSTVRWLSSLASACCCGRGGAR